MRLLIFGRSGQLARALLEAARRQGLAAVAAGRPETDLTDPAAVERAFDAARPEVVANVAAHTAVDAAEDEPDRAFAVNEAGARTVAAAAHERGAALLHVSTDYVFDGRKGAPYREGDPAAPINVYGASKLAGERAVLAAHPDALIVRTSWLFDGQGTNFPRAILRRALTGQVLRVVDDQVGCPTPTAELAEALLAVLFRTRRGEARGVLHLCGAPATTWYGFALEVLAEASRHGFPSPPVHPIATAEYGAKAARPPDSRLDCRLAMERFGLVQPDWRAALPRDIPALCRTLAASPRAGESVHPRELPR